MWRWDWWRNTQTERDRESGEEGRMCVFANWRCLLSRGESSVFVSLLYVHSGSRGGASVFWKQASIIFSTVKREEHQSLFSMCFVAALSLVSSLFSSFFSVAWTVCVFHRRYLHACICLGEGIGGPTLCKSPEKTSFLFLQATTAVFFHLFEFHPHLSLARFLLSLSLSILQTGPPYVYTRVHLHMRRCMCSSHTS